MYVCELQWPLVFECGAINHSFARQAGASSHTVEDRERRGLFAFLLRCYERYVDQQEQNNKMNLHGGRGMQASHHAPRRRDATTVSPVIVPEKVPDWL